MADSKISALPASTTPLAGTEVLPIVQSSTTKQVSVANLTAGRAVSALSLTSTTTLGVTGTSTLSGNAIISVTDNTNAALRITQLGTGNALLVEDSTNPDATPFAISSSGQVVIGNTTATGFVPGVSPNFQVMGTDNASASTIVARYSADTSGPFILYTKSRGALGAQGIVSSGDNIGAQIWGASDGTTPIIAARIDAVVDGTPGTNDMPGRLVFSTTADGASSPTERMRIDSSGNVGIGGAPYGSNKITVLGTLPSAGNSTYAINSTGTIPSSSTTEASGFISNYDTQNAAVTYSWLAHYIAAQGTISGGTRIGVTNQTGFQVNNTLTSATNNYGFYGNIASGTGRYNLYMAGTAANYLGGALSVAGDLSIAAYTETIVASGTVGASATLAITAGTVLTATLTSATACTFTMPTATAGKSFILLLKQPASGTATTATFTSVKWNSSGAPTITATVGKMDILTFVSDGTNWYGSYSQGYTP